MKRKMNAGTGAGAGAGANARKRKRMYARARSFIHSFMCPRDDEENPKRPNCYAKRKRAHERTNDENERRHMCKKQLKSAPTLAS